MTIYKEHRENKDLKGQLDLKESKDLEVYKVYKDLKEGEVPSDPKEIEALKGFKENVVRLVLKENKEYREK